MKFTTPATPAPDHDPFDDIPPPEPWQPKSTLEYLGGNCDHDPFNPDE